MTITNQIITDQKLKIQIDRINLNTLLMILIIKSVYLTYETDGKTEKNL